MRKFKGAIISILILLLLVGVYFLISNIEFNNETQTEVTEESQPFGDIFTVSKEEIVYMGVENSHGKYSFEYTDCLWSCVDDKSISLDQEIVSDKVFLTSYYDAYTITEGEYNPADFGLDNPTMVIKIRLADEAEHIFTFGSIAPTDDFLYYMTVDDRPAVYAILGTKYDLLNLPLGAYRETEFFTFDYNGIKKITISGRDKEAIVIQENTAENSALLSNWLMTSPYNKPVNEFTLNNLIIAPLSEQAIEIMSYVEDKPASLGVYGLDNPRYVIYFAYADRTLTIKLGNDAENGGVYAMKSDSQTVYTVSYNRFSFVEYSAFELVDKSVYSAVITDLSSFSINDGKNNYEISIPSKGTNYKINGKKTTESKVKDFYEQLASLTIGGIVKESVSSGAEVVFTYNYTNGSIARVEFIPYSTRQYAVRINGGKADFYVKKSDVSNLISRIAEL